MRSSVPIVGGLSIVTLVAMLLSPPAAAGPASPKQPIQISVMSQNILYGADDWDLETGEWCDTADGCPQGLRKVGRIIAASGADVVGLQEPERNTRRLANLLGWYASPRAHVISRFPIIDPPRSGGTYVFVEPTPGRVVAVANVHLPSTPYGPYEFRDGATREEVRELERTLRVRALQRQLSLLPRLVDQGIPVVLTGDFNSPSHLDWTQPVADARDDVPFGFRWPVSAALAKAGFVDSYREAHPDPVATPGFTWTPGGPETDPEEIFDRIDWVLHSGAVATIESRLVGEKGGPDVDLGFPAPYPVDHRGVVSTLEVEPGRMPILVAVDDRLVTIGDHLNVRYHAGANPNQRVVLLAARGSGWNRVLSRPAPGTDGEVIFPTRGLRERRYVVALADGRVAVPQTLTPVWAYERSTQPSITAQRDRYREGQTLRFSWTAAPGNGLDWVGIFRCDREHCQGNGRYLLYDYTHTRIEGDLEINREDTGEGSVPWPLPPGTYVARLLIDDSYVSIAQTARFRIVER